MAIRRFVVTATVNGSGAGTFYTPYFSGKIHSIRYKRGTFASTADFTTTLDGTGETVWTEANVTASGTRYPRAPTHTAAGAAAVFTSDAKPVLDRIAVAADRVKIVVAQGGTSTTATVHVTVDG